MDILSPVNTFQSYPLGNQGTRSMDIVSPVNTFQPYPVGHQGHHINTVDILSPVHTFQPYSIGHQGHKVNGHSVSCQYLSTLSNRGPGPQGQCEQVPYTL